MPKKKEPTTELDTAAGALEEQAVVQQAEPIEAQTAVGYAQGEFTHPVPVRRTRPPEPVPRYTVEEFIANPRLFAFRPDIVSAALRHAGVTSCTIDEAKSIVTQFAERKV